MNDMMFHLAFILDKEGNNGINLVSFQSLRELDNFILKNFKSHEDVRKAYNEDIAEFCLKNREFIQKENSKNQRDWTGSIVIIAEKKGKYFHKLKVLYNLQDRLLPLNDSIRKIRLEMHNMKVLQQIRKRKNFLLSPNAKKLLWKNDNSIDDYYLDMAIDFFTKRIQRNDEWSYYCRRTLMNVCHLARRKVKISKGIINIESDKELGDYKLKHAPSTVHFEEMLNRDNYEELYKYYDLDEIVVNTHYFDKEKAKGKR